MAKAKKPLTQENIAMLNSVGIPVADHSLLSNTTCRDAMILPDNASKKVFLEGKIKSARQRAESNVFFENRRTVFDVVALKNKETGLPTGFYAVNGLGGGTVIVSKATFPNLKARISEIEAKVMA